MTGLERFFSNDQQRKLFGNEMFNRPLIHWNPCTALKVEPSLRDWNSELGKPKRKAFKTAQGLFNVLCLFFSHSQLGYWLQAISVRFFLGVGGGRWGAPITGLGDSICPESKILSLFRITMHSKTLFCKIRVKDKRKQMNTRNDKLSSSSFLSSDIFINVENGWISLNYVFKINFHEVSLIN